MRCSLFLSLSLFYSTLTFELYFRVDGYFVVKFFSDKNVLHERQFCPSFTFNFHFYTKCHFLFVMGDESEEREIKKRRKILSPIQMMMMMMANICM